MQAQNIVEFVRATTAVTGKAAILIEAVNSGGNQRMGEAFPAIENAYELNDGPIVLPFDTETEARAAYTKIEQDFAEYASLGLVTTSIYLVNNGQIPVMFEN